MEFGRVVWATQVARCATDLRVRGGQPCAGHWCSQAGGARPGGTIIWKLSHDPPDHLTASALGGRPPVVRRRLASVSRARWPGPFGRKGASAYLERNGKRSLESPHSRTWLVIALDSRRPDLAHHVSRSRPLTPRHLSRP